MTEDPTTQISQDEINSILWKACDTFRGTVDPSEYKNYILVMLFLKYISDVWMDKKAEYRERFKGDEKKVQRRMKRERFVLPEGADYYSIYEQRGENNLGEIIDIALAAIEEANIEKLQGVFRNISFNSEAALGQTKTRNERLKNLLADFHDPRLDMRPSRINGLDIIGNAYEYLIGKFAAGAGKKAGEFYTPPEVSRLLAMLLDPQTGERIYDPACGSGSLLIKCAEEVDSENYSLFGQESNGSTWALAMMNMFLHDVSQPKIEWGDTIRDPAHTENDNLMRFNVVAANPPFSLDKWGAGGAANDSYGRFWRGIPPKSKGDYAFITHMIESTYVEGSQNGRVGVVVPHGVLFRGGAEGKIRKKFIEENLLDAVIGLPPNLFFGTGIPAAILLFKRERADTCVLFIDASRDFEQGSAQNKLREAELEKILNTYAKRQTVEKYAYLAEYAEIEENDFNLNIPRYVDTFEPEPPVDMAAVNVEISTLKDELGEVEEKMVGYLQELGLDE
ncbi:MAG: type I restriction-modification system subunit M [Anaerolineae bacterium]|nr:type I restriction-modification system subunit M [Anaerolineae bacterium]MBT7191791.1 type I restriction-modification system subunit M [Anaerolineae bacterium]MBT7776018.1 type I restriction-modification system subunit M [Anaerolineae bacterium]